MKRGCGLLLLLLSLPSWGALSKTYPTAATTQLRWDAYVDAMVQVASSPAAGPFRVARPFKPPEVPPNLPIEFQWLYIGGSSITAFWFMPDAENVISGRIASLQTMTPTTYSFAPSSFTMFDVLKAIRDNTKFEDINIISDQMEQYMIWPDTDVAHMYIQGSTTTLNPNVWPPAGGWKGWCFSIINGKEVPVACPPQ